MNKPYHLVSRDYHALDEEVYVADDIIFARRNFCVIAGPCTVEDRVVIEETAHFLAELGVKMLRGGTFKARTSPHSFQGLGAKGLKYLRNAADQCGMKTVTEILGEQLVEQVSEYADILQVGSRNSQNFRLLSLLAKQAKPVLLKRGFMNTIAEFLSAAEYLAADGKRNIILCERGIRTFEPMTRNTLDISAVPLVQSESCLPIIVDPSHAAGRTDIILPLTRAAIACGAQGAIIEVHPQPHKALCDGKQSLSFKQFTSLWKNIGQLTQALEIERV